MVKLKSSDESKAYKLTKSLAVKYATDLVKHLPEWLNKFNSHKKKDDLPDAFLQGAYYFEMNIKLDDSNKIYNKNKKETKDKKGIKNKKETKEILIKIDTENKNVEI